MKVYEGANVRNVALVGHGHAGKTSSGMGRALHRGRNPAPGPSG